ncbi:hypothetical protein C3L33_14460, partial [Rhododendron williamsianum]
MMGRNREEHITLHTSSKAPVEGDLRKCGLLLFPSHQSNITDQAAAWSSRRAIRFPIRDKRKSPRVSFRDSSSTPSFGSNLPDLDKTQLEASRLLDILTKKSSFPGSFISIPEIQARNKVLKHCGLPDEEYLVLFTSTYKDAMMLVGESYPFFRGNFYMTVIGEESDYIREFASYKESKVIVAPETWLDLRIKGSQLRTRGMFCLMHHIGCGRGPVEPRASRPDFVLCSPDNNRAIIQRSPAFWSEENPLIHLFQLRDMITCLYAII